MAERALTGLRTALPTDRILHTLLTDRIPFPATIPQPFPRPFPYPFPYRRTTALPIV